MSVVLDWPGEIWSAIERHPGTAIAIGLAFLSFLFTLWREHEQRKREDDRDERERNRDLRHERERAEDRGHADERVARKLKVNVVYSDEVSGGVKGRQIQFPIANEGLVNAGVLGVPSITIAETGQKIVIDRAYWFWDKEPGAQLLEPSDAFLTGLWCAVLAKYLKDAGLTGTVRLIATSKDTTHKTFSSEPIDFDVDHPWQYEVANQPVVY